MSPKVSCQLLAKVNIPSAKVSFYPIDKLRFSKFISNPKILWLILNLD